MFYILIKGGMSSITTYSTVLPVGRYLLVTCLRDRPNGPCRGGVIVEDLQWYSHHPSLNLSLRVPKFRVETLKDLHEKKVEKLRT